MTILGSIIGSILGYLLGLILGFDIGIARYGCFNNGRRKLAALQKVSTCKTRFIVCFSTLITLIVASLRLRFCNNKNIF